MKKLLGSSFKFSSLGWLLLLTAGGVAVVYFLGGLGKILEKLGLKDDAIDKIENETAEVLAKNDAKLTIAVREKATAAIKQQYLKEKSTKNDAEWVIIADTIYNSLGQMAIDDDKEEAGYQLCRVQNDTDVYKLIEAFGTRWEYFIMVPMSKMNLASFVVSNLSKDKIFKINDNYLRKRIKFRW